MSNTRCESCSMPIETGHYCSHCANERGELSPFEERLERMTQFWASRNPGLSRDECEEQTLAFMAQMPAWKDHPSLLARLKH